MKKQNETELVRPFLSEQIWALYAAYHSFLSARLAKASLLTISGIDHAEVLSRFNERELVQKSAPVEIFAAYDKNPYVGTEPYLRYLREEMLMQFREFLSKNPNFLEEVREKNKGFVKTQDLLEKMAFEEFRTGTLNV